MKNKTELAVVIVASAIVGFLAGRLYQHITSPTLEPVIMVKEFSRNK